MKHCVITGAADGIGKALAQRCGAAGYTITGIDRDAERAAATEAELRQQGISASFVVADLGQTADIDRVLDQLKAAPAIDVLIHNAGINAVGRFERSPIEQQHAVLDVNLLAPMLLTAELLRTQRVTAGGSLVFVASLSHFVGYPGAAVYAASKDGLTAYARSVAAARRDLHVLTVFPGPTRTAHARRYSPDNRREQRRMPPEELADVIYRAIEARRRYLIPGRSNQVFAAIGRYMPALTLFLLRKTLLEKLP